MFKKDADIIQGIGGKTGEAMWKEIDDLVTRWALRNPRAANWNRIYNQHIRDGLKDKKFAVMGGRKANFSGGTRTTLSIHPELVNYIEVFYPKFFESKENVRRFGNTYKMFKIPEKI